MFTQSKNAITSFALLFSITCTMAQKTDKKFLKNLMENNRELFSTILNHPHKKEVQLLYTQINRDKDNHPSFKSFSYNLDETRYFYPASTVKLAAVVFALEKANALNISPDLFMYTDSSYSGQTKVSHDKSASSGKPSIAHYVKKILLTSDNDAFNRLYEFIGRAEFNAKLKAHGLKNSRVTNRLAIGDGGEASKHTNPIKFYDGTKLVMALEGKYDPLEYPLTLTNLVVGIGYLDSKDRLVNEPFSFENKNAFPIADQQLLMKKLIFPEAFEEQKRFNLTTADYALIYTYMNKLPTESDFPSYDAKQFWPAYAKMIYYGRDKQANMSNDVKIYNKYGDSYGYIIDNAYLVDFKNGVEFMLTAVVQSNDDGIYNDNKYEYETVCYPFMKNIGQLLYAHELKRKKKFMPKLNQLREISVNK